MINQLLGFFADYPFLWRAAVVGTLVSLCASLLGVTLVLKRYSMLGDGLSHVGFGAMAVAAVAGVAPLKIAIPVVVIAAVIMLRLEAGGKLKGDAATAIISTASLAAGVVLVSLGGTNVDLSSYMFGSILALDPSDVALSAAVSGAVLILYVLFYPRIFAVTFDEGFARATGTKSGVYDMLIAVLTALTVVLGMRLTGALLISALIVFPPVTSMRVFKSFRAVVISSACVSVVCFLTGLALSYFAALPAGASVVVVNAVCYLAFAAAGVVKNKLHKKG